MGEKVRIILLTLLTLQMAVAQSDITQKIDSLFAKKLFGEIVRLVDGEGNVELTGDRKFYYSLALAQIGEHERSLTSFNALKDQEANTSSLYNSSLFYIGILERDHFNLGNAVSAFTELIDKDSLEYSFYPELIQSYFKMEDYSSARPYQDFLYRAYRAKRLPQHLSHIYVYDTFVVDSFFVRCSEAYPELGSAEAQGSFSKTFAYVVNQEGQLQYVLETVKIHQIKESPKKYLLNKRFYDGQWKLLNSKSYWQYTFADPIDYSELKKAIVEVVQLNAQPGVETKYNEH